MWAFEALLYLQSFKVSCEFTKDNFLGSNVCHIQGKKKKNVTFFSLKDGRIKTPTVKLQGKQIAADLQNY